MSPGLSEDLGDEGSTAVAGSLISSIKYSNLKDGKAININIIAGVIVHINSINVPWFKYLWEIKKQSS